MKIIFLDMDGPLCTYRSHVAQGCQTPNGIMHSLDREAVGLLNVLAEGVPDEESRYVLISTWRQIYPREWMEDHLRAHGWRGAFHDDWRTGDEGGEHNRGHEVARWLAQHEDIKEWVIIDDGSGFLPEQQPRHVKVKYDDGLSWHDFCRACLILHGNRTTYGRAIMD